MANFDQLRILKQGVEAWNKWRKENQFLRPDLRGAKLSKAILNEANLMDADLGEMDLSGAQLIDANFFESFLNNTNFHKAELSNADLRLTTLEGADLREANLNAANLAGADLTGADLSNSDLTGASLVGAVVNKTRISGSRIYGTSVWDLRGEFEDQKNLVISPKLSPDITVDNIKVAQFIYMFPNLTSLEIREIINRITSKSSLIPGQSSIPEHKAIVGVLINKLRK